MKSHELNKLLYDKETLEKFLYYANGRRCFPHLTIITVKREIAKINIQIKKVQEENLVV